MFFVPPVRLLGGLRSDAGRSPPARRIPPDVSQRIGVARIVMIVGIVILHVPPHVGLSETPSDIPSLIKAFFSEALFRATVPILTCISGYLLFTKFPSAPFLPILRNKTRTVLVPMLIFSVPLVAGLYVVQASHIVDHDFSVRLVPMNLSKFLNYSLGLTVSPVNYPLNFLRDLFVVSLLAPVFAVFLHRAPIVGLLACFGVFWFNLDGPLVIRGTMPINFYLGGLASVRALDVNSLDRYRASLLALLVALCVVIVAFEVEDRSWFLVLAPFLVWPALSYLASGRCGEFLRRIAPVSFFIFLTHAPLLLATWLVFRRLGHVEYFVYWMAAPFVTVLTAYALYLLLGRLFPKTMKIALGGR